MALFLAIMVLNCARFAYFTWVGIPPDFSIADNGSAANVISPLVAAMLPVIGTTAFTLMCSERLRRQWEQAASTDHLTGLAEPPHPHRDGPASLRAGAHPGWQVAIALIDIDAFKSINDRYGHEAGDLALQHVAASLESAMGPSDLLARTGGEEFVALLGNTDAAAGPAGGGASAPGRAAPSLPAARTADSAHRVRRDRRVAGRGSRFRQPAPARRPGDVRSQIGRSESGGTGGLALSRLFVRPSRGPASRAAPARYPAGSPP
jgi:GGDEF domain-containing protein